MSDKQIITTPSLFKIDETFDDPRMMRVRIAVMNSGENFNRSTFSTKVIKSAKESFTNIPVLANVVTTYDEDGNERLDFGSHDMHKEDDLFNEGERRTIYDEKVVGIIPSENDFEIVHNDELDVDTVWVTAYLFRYYGNYVADILESRGGTTSVSAELIFDQTSYDAKNKLIVVEAFTMLGVTLLGEDVAPAMKDAHASVFSLNKDSRDEQMLSVMKELTKALEKYTATFADKNPKRKEEKEMKKADLIDKASEDTMDKASTAAFAEQVEENEESSSEGLEKEEMAEATEESEAAESGESETFDDDSSSDSDDSASDGEDSTEDSAEDSADETAEAEAEEDVAAEEESNEDEAAADIADDSDNENTGTEEADTLPSTGKVVYSITYGDETHSYAVTSLNEEICAITNLVNMTYGEEDNDYYSCEVFSDHTVLFHGWYRSFKQKYTEKNGVYSLKGERTEVFARYLTQDEIEALDGLKAKFAEVSDKLALYEDEPEKLSILESEDYSLIKDTDEYKELAKRENYFNLSTEDLTAKLDAMITSYAKGLSKETFAVEDSKKEEEPKRDFFAFAIHEQKSSFLDGLLGK